MAQMSENWKQRIASAKAEGELTDSGAVWAGLVEEEVWEDPDFDPNDPANDPRSEWTFVRDGAL